MAPWNISFATQSLNTMKFYSITTVSHQSVPSVYTVQLTEAWWYSSTAHGGLQEQITTLHPVEEQTREKVKNWTTSVSFHCLPFDITFRFLFFSLFERQYKFGGITMRAGQKLLFLVHVLSQFLFSFLRSSSWRSQEFHNPWGKSCDSDCLETHSAF